ncbi:hypothetical protein Tco_1210934 [Tanacetum coccineum]
MMDEEVFAGQDVVDKEVSTADLVTTAGEVVTTASVKVSAATTTTTTAITKVDLTLAQALAELRSAKPKLQAEEEEQARLAREKAEEVEEANISWDNVKDIEEQVKVQNSKLFDQAMTRVNMFIDIDTELVKESSKKVEAEMAQEVELQSMMEVIPDEEEVVVDAIPLATKPPSIVDWKIIKEGKTGYYQIIRDDRNSKSSRNNEVFRSILLVIMKLSMKKFKILKINIKFRGGLLGLKAS